MASKNRQRRRSGLHWALVAFVPIVVAALVILARLEPDPRGLGTHESLGLDPCITMELWGVPCPGCGVTTSVALALDGELWASFKNQPFGFTVALLLIAYLVLVPVGHLLGRDLGVWLSRPPNRYVLIGALLLILGSWAWKFALVTSAG